MRKNRTGYSCMILLMAILLYDTGRPFLLGMLILLCVLPLLMAVLLRADAKNLKLQMQMSSGGSAEKTHLAEMTVKCRKKIRAAGSIQVRVRISNKMFGTEEEKVLFLEPLKKEKSYCMQMNMVLCGETVIECRSVQVYDLLKLFCMKLPPFQEARTTIYPERLQLEVELEKRMEGVLAEAGMQQNRKGNDPSEMSDIREYVPGDDIRSIHWKLSSKTDRLILRQPSALMHYQAALMPDFGKEQGKVVTEAEWNRAAAVFVAAAEQLLQMGTPFCMLLPLGGELEVTEIRNRRELRMALSRWLGTPMQEHGAGGIRYFQLAHMERYFTRLLVVTAGTENTDMEIQMEQIRIIWFTATEKCQKLLAEKWKNNMVIKIPAMEKEKGIWHVIC